MNEVLESLLIIYLKLQVYSGLFGIALFIIWMIISAFIDLQRKKAKDDYLGH